MSYRIGLLASLGAMVMAGEAYAVGECNSNLYGPNSTACCATSNMSGGGNCFVPADTQYQFTIVSFAFEKSDGSIVTLGSETVFNAASADAGNAMGNFIAGASLPAGTYVAVRPTVRTSITVNNSAVTTTDGRSCTAGAATGSFNDGGFMAVCAAGQPNAAVPACINASDSTLVSVRDTSLGSIVYNGSSALSISFTFNTGNGVMCTFAPGAGAQASKAAGPLTVTMALQ